mmetsp:Transcript_10641/g.28398  ORF Transcript_10641/g.28398 Transcript_10641/m.28398 type:complete len:442 (+) Transcript_10641:115-1440(+)
MAKTSVTRWLRAMAGGVAKWHARSGNAERAPFCMMNVGSVNPMRELSSSFGAQGGDVAAVRASAGTSKDRKEPSSSAKSRDGAARAGGVIAGGVKSEASTILSAIQPPLTSHAKRKGVLRAAEEVGDRICAAYCVPSGLRIAKVRKHLDPALCEVMPQGLSPDVVHARVPPSKLDALYGEAAEPSHGNPVSDASDKALCGHVFMFESGSVVFWGVEVARRRRLLDALLGFRGDAGDGSHTSIAMSEFDHEFRFETGATNFSAAEALNKDKSPARSRFSNDVFFISDFENVEDLLALSFGLAQSVKLLVYEESIDRLVERTRELPRDLALTGRISMSSKSIKRIIGELLAARYAVNLLSDILDTPEFFWEYPELGNLFFQTCNELELSKRSSLLDKRMQTIKDVLDVLNNEIASSSSHRVERAILVLIAFELLLSISTTFFH